MLLDASVHPCVRMRNGQSLTSNIACNILLGMRAYVLDTDVLVAAFRSDAGASRQVLEAARARRFELLLSVPLMLEYESVLTRPEHLAACGASVEDVSAVLDELASVGKRIELVIRTRPMLPDPNDEMVLETAINGRADAIITFNDRDFRPVATRFRCSVLRPGEVVRRLTEEAK
jgi:putative PIN family toxin of toxin-antitoxin system